MKKLILLLVGGLFVIGIAVAAVFYMAPKDELAKADAIVAVSGGDTVARANEAVRLYKEGWASFLIFSGAAKDPSSPSNAQAMRQIALSQGVPPDVIAIDESSLNTAQNANEVTNIIKAFEFKDIILVTSPYHQRRVNLEFRKRLGDSLTIINHPAPDQDWSKRRWWLSPKGWYLTLTEVPKTLFAQLIQ